MNGRVAKILAFHAIRSFDSRENLIQQENGVAQIYRSLGPDEAAALARLVVEGADPGQG